MRSSGKRQKSECLFHGDSPAFHLSPFPPVHSHHVLQITDSLRISQSHSVQIIGESKVVNLSSSGGIGSHATCLYLVNLLLMEAEMRIEITVLKGPSMLPRELKGIAPGNPPTLQPRENRNHMVYTYDTYRLDIQIHNQKKTEVHLQTRYAPCSLKRVRNA